MSSCDIWPPRPNSITWSCPKPCASLYATTGSTKSIVILPNPSKVWWEDHPWRGDPPRGGYSLCDGWYICAAVLTPFFHFGRIEHDLFGVFFLIHQHKNELLGTNLRKIRSFWPQNTIFPSIFLGPIFSGPRHTPSNFRTEYPPRGSPLSYLADGNRALRKSAV